MTQKNQNLFKIISQPSIEIYIGRNGHIVIKQLMDYPYEQEDNFIFINPACVKDIIQILEDISIELKSYNIEGCNIEEEDDE